MLVQARPLAQLLVQVLPPIHLLSLSLTGDRDKILDYRGTFGSSVQSHLQWIESTRCSVLLLRGLLHTQLPMPGRSAHALFLRWPCMIDSKSDIRLLPGGRNY